MPGEGTGSAAMRSALGALQQHRAVRYSSMLQVRLALCRAQGSTRAAPAIRVRRVAGCAAPADRRGFWRGGGRPQSKGPAPGLFAIDGLHTPDDFLRLASTSVESCSSLLETIIVAPPSAHVLHLMDEMSEQLCRVMDAAELCRNVHPDPAWRRSSNAVYAHLASFIQRLNSTPELHAKLVAVLTDDAVVSTLCPEERIVGTQLREDMERNGVHLPPADRQRYAALQAELLELSSEFMENAATSNTLELSAEQMAELPRAVRILFTTLPGGAGSVVCDRAMSSRLLKWVANGAIRREIYIAANSSAEENLGVLHRILQCRHEMAGMLGENSYGEYVARAMMAGDVDTIDAFLSDLLESTRPKARRELKQLAEAKAQTEEGCELLADGGAAVLYPWDTQYYMGLTKATAHRIDAKDISSYFSLDNCLNGLNLMVSRLFSMSLQRVDFSPDEVWDASVSKVALVHRVEGLVGYVYLDLHPRAGKHSHLFAQFSIQCGSRRTGRTPSVALVCNFERSGPDGSVSLLGHSEVETLFHEFGHAIHALLSRTYFQHSSGTRTLLDFVETPSTLMEYFVWDESFVTEWAMDYRTGDPIPAGTIKALLQSKYMYGALELQQQLSYAMLDQRYHREPVERADWDSTAAFAALHADCADPDGRVVTWCEGTHWQSQFNHLVSYGAGYYSYLYSRMFAAHIWHKRFGSVGLDHEAVHKAGQELREQLLAPGGSRPPEELLREYLGEDPSIESMIAELGAP